MTLKRKSIRNTFVGIVDAAVSERVFMNRIFEHEIFPSYNFKSGVDIATDDYASGSHVREYAVIGEIRVAAKTSDDDLDDLLEKILQVIKANRSSGVWLFCWMGDVQEPDDDFGKTNYSKLTFEIIFKYED